MRIDRWNAGTLRRYHLPSGAIVAVCGRDARVIPAWCRHISVEVSREAAADILRTVRKATS